MRGWRGWVGGLLAVVGVAAAAVTAGVSSADKGLRTVVVLAGTAVVAAGVSVGGAALQRSRERAAAAAGAGQARRELLDRLAVGCEGGRLPRLGAVDVEVLGVRRPRTSTLRPREQLPYAARSRLDPVVAEALGEHRFVLVHGPSTAGKSRSTAEVARRLYGDRPVLVPADTAGAVDQVLGGGVDLSQAVVWLDDLDRHIGLGLTASTVRRLLQIPGLRIVATMRAAGFEQFQEREQIRSPGREVIDLAHLVEFTGWDRADRDHARQQLADHPDVADVTAALERGLGLGEYLSAGPELISRLTRGEPDPAGVAVTQAAGAWYRAGLTRPAPLELVRQLYPHYLPPDDATQLGRFDHGLTWASSPVAGARILTHRTDGTGLTVHDYVLDHLTATHPAGLPPPAWDALANHLHDQPSDMLTIGATAYLTHHDPATAERFTRTAADAGDADAMFNLGALLQERGETAEAERWYRTTADAGHTNAMNNLGLLLQERGETAEAERWWHTAADAGNTSAMSNLGVLLEGRGETAEAERWYRTASEAGNTSAMFNLGALLKERGDSREENKPYP